MTRLDYPPKFRCSKEGHCCKDFCGKTDIRKFRRMMFQLSRGGIYWSLKAEDISLVLFGWEKDDLLTMAENSSLEVDIIPALFTVEERERKLVAQHWTFRGHQSCPFLDKDGLCKIYERRPLQCKGFPLSPTHTLGLLEVHPYCPNATLVDYGDKLSGAKWDLVGSYGDMVGYALAFGQTLQVIYSLQSNMISRGLLTPDTSRKLHSARRLVDEWGFMDMFEFALQKGWSPAEYRRAKDVESFMKSWRATCSEELKMHRTLD